MPDSRRNVRRCALAPSPIGLGLTCDQGAAHGRRGKSAVVRETVRQLNEPALSEVRGGIIVPTTGCVPATYRHSCFDSCYKTDCCLMIP